MVKIEVEGILFELSDLDVKNSTTLSESAVCQGVDQTIKLQNYSLQQWTDYLNILQVCRKVSCQASHEEVSCETLQTTTDDDTTITSKINYEFDTEYARQHKNMLQIVDYLNNKQQLQLWYEAVKRYYNMNLAKFSSCLTDTAFTLADLDPIFGVRNISQIAACIRDLKQLPALYIEHICYTLYDKRDYTVYSDLNLHIRDSQNSWMFGPVYKSRIRDNFIIVGNLEAEVDVSVGSLVSLSPYWYQTNPTLVPNIISPRVACYYRHSHRIYRVDTFYQELLLVCPEVHLYLNRSAGSNGSLITRCVADADDANVEPINDSLTDSDYVPLATHDSGSKLGGYSLHTYNKLTDYNRGYYMFLVYEVDPIAKILYAFCV